MKVLYLKKEKILYAELAKLYSKNMYSIREIMKKEKEIHASFVVRLHAVNHLAAS